MENKIWFITGISSGLGKAIADTVISKGDFVIGTFRKKEQVDSFNALHHNKAFAYQLDITDLNQIENVVKNIQSDFGRIDVLVNNAGIGFVGAVEEATMEEIRSVFEANVFGTLKLTQTVLPLMREQKSGHIIQISSHAGVKAFAGFGIYNASKFALEGFSEALADEVKPLGIKVTIVEPGPFRTKFAGSSLKQSLTVLDAYTETAGLFREKLLSVDGKQEGHPAKASEAIFDLVYSENTTLRLPLGKVSIQTIGMKIESLTSDLEKNKSISESCVY